MKKYTKIVFRYWYALSTSYGLQKKGTLEKGWRPPFYHLEPCSVQSATGNDSFCTSSLLYGCDYKRDEPRNEEEEFVEVECDGLLHKVRYYSSGLSEENKTLMIYIHGDVISMKASGVRMPHPNYLNMTPIKIKKQMSDWSQKSKGMPTVFIARPGTYGSSGNHEQRRTKSELTILNRAIDKIKKRHSVDSLMVCGQSGGGLLAAGLLEIRSDIKFAVLASAVLDTKGHFSYSRRVNPIPGWPSSKISKYYSPIESAQPVHNPKTGVFVVSDPRDTVVPLVFQRRYCNHLRSKNFHCEQVFAYAPQGRFHDLSLVGRRILSDLVECDAQSVRVERLSQFSQNMCDIGAKSYLLSRIAGDTGKISNAVLAKNYDAEFIPASLTKVLTAVTALIIWSEFQIGADIGDFYLKICKSDLVGGSGANLCVGDHISFRDALANMFLASSNDTANMIARVFGDFLEPEDGLETPLKKFVGRMNFTARDIGMKASNFSNPSGLASPNQRTTANDVSLMMAKASTFEDINSLWGMPSHKIAFFGDKYREIEIKHTASLAKNERVIGAKTGTIFPGHFHISLIYQDSRGDQFVLTALGASSRNSRIYDASKMISWLEPNTQ